MISFGIPALTPSLVAGYMGHLVQHWVATLTPLPIIMGQVFSDNFVDTYYPVVSSREAGHFTVVRPSNFTIGGRRIVCHNRCSQRLSSKALTRSGGKKKWEITCPECQHRASYTDPDDLGIEERDKNDILKIPGAKFLRTPYPIPTKYLNWKKVEPPPQMPPKMLAPPLPLRPVKSLPLPQMPSKMNPHHVTSKPAVLPHTPTDSHLPSITTRGWKVQEGNSPDLPGRFQPLTLDHKVPRVRSDDTLSTKRHRRDSSPPQPSSRKGGLKMVAEGSSKAGSSKRPRKCEDPSITLLQALH